MHVWLLGDMHRNYPEWYVLMGQGWTRGLFKSKEGGGG